MQKRKTGQKLIDEKSGSETPSSMAISGIGKQTEFTNISIQESNEKGNITPKDNV